MNPIFRDVLDRIERLPPDTQRMLANELGQRAREISEESSVRIDEYDPSPKCADDIYRELAARYGRR